MSAVSFVRDESHWLFRHSPAEWVRAGLGEARRAEEAYARGDARGGLAGARRAAGMALNGVLIVAPDERWGRTYIEHLVSLKADASAPEAVRTAATVLVDTPPPSPDLVILRRKDHDVRVVEAARDVIAHAYALVCRAEPSA